MAASLGPLVGAIDQGTSSTRFLVSAAPRSGPHRGQPAPPRPEGSRGFHAFTPLHPGGGLCRALGEGQGSGPAGPGCAVPAAASCVPEKRRRSARGCRSRRCPSVAVPARGAVPGRAPHRRRLLLLRGTARSPCSGRAAWALRRVCGLPAVSPRVQSNGQGPQALGR